MKFNKILALLLCFALVLAAFPALAQTEEIKWVCKKSTRVNESTGDLWYPEIPQGYGDYFTGWGSISDDAADWWGHALHIGHTNCWLSYTVPVQTAGIYELFVTAGTYENFPATILTEVNGVATTSTVIDTCDWEPNVKVSLGYIPLNEGDNDIKISIEQKSGGALALQYFLLEPVPLPIVTDVIAGSESLAGSIIRRGTDNIRIVCTNPFDIETAKDAEILLTDTDSNEIPVKITADKNEFVLSLMKTLFYEKDYTLTVTGLKDAYGYTLEDMQIPFTTSGENVDIGEDSAIIISAPDLQNTTVITVEGQVKNSLGDGIAGRMASLEIKAPDGTDVITLETVSLADGKVNFSYELPENAVAGKYKVILKSEYSDTSDESEVRYISEGLKLQILGEIKETDSASGVEGILSLYSQELGIDLTQLDKKTDEESGEIVQYGLTDKSFFYGRFIGKEFEKLEDFNSSYKTNLALELFLQNGDAKARADILSDEEYSQSLGIDITRMGYLNAENKALFKNDLALVKRSSADTIEKLVYVYNDLTNKYFLIQNSKGNIILSAKDVTVYVGQQAEIKLDCGNVEDLLGYSLEIKYTDNTAEKINLEADCTANPVRTSDAASVKFVVEKLKKSEYQSLGTVTCETDSEGEIEFTISGLAFYQIEGFPYVLYAEIESADVKVTVNKNSSSSSPSHSSTPGLSGGGGGGGGSSSSKTSKGEQSKPLDEEKPVEVENVKREFTDLEEVSWAKESIDYLYAKGIIAESADGKFRPNDAVTRAEFIKMLVMIMGIYDDTSVCTFSDVSKESWYSAYVASAQKNGMIQGNEKNLFNPDAEITRQDICVILSRIMDKLGYEDRAYEPHFADDGAISEYAKNAVYRLYEFKVINGVGNNIFAPLNSATRAMSAKMLVQFLKGVEAA